MKKNLFFYLIVIFAIILTSCDTPSNYVPTATSVATSAATPDTTLQINDPTFDSSEQNVLEYQPETVNNCTGALPLYTVSYDLESTNEATFTVIAGMGGGFEGGIPDVISAQLNTKIEVAVSQKYGKIVFKQHTVPLNTPSGQKVEYTIIWKVKKATGTILAIYNNQPSQAQFSEIIDINLDNLISKNLSCDDPDTTIETPTSISDQPTDTPVPAPIATDPIPTSPIPNYSHTPDPHCQQSTNILNVTQVGTNIVVANISTTNLTALVSWDGEDPYGLGTGSDHHYQDLSPGQEFSWPIKTHFSVDVWAWGGPNGSCVGQAYLLITP